MDFKQTETKTNGEITEKRKYILVEIINSIDYAKIISDEKLFQAKCEEIGTFVLDSVEFDHKRCHYQWLPTGKEREPWTQIRVPANHSYEGEFGYFQEVAQDPWPVWEKTR